jgi:hypothetical protein
MFTAPQTLHYLTEHSRLMVTTEEDEELVAVRIDAGVQTGVQTGVQSGSLPCTNDSQTSLVY